MTYMARSCTNCLNLSIIFKYGHEHIVIILILDHYYVVMVKTVYNQIYIVYLASSWGILNILTTAVKVGLEVLSFWMNTYYSFWKDTLTWWSSKEIFFLDAKIIFYSWWLEKNIRWQISWHLLRYNDAIRFINMAYRDAQY